MPLLISGLGRGFLRYIVAFVLGLCLVAVLGVFLVPARTGPYTAVSGPATVVNVVPNVELWRYSVSVCAPQIKVAVVSVPEPLKAAHDGILPLVQRNVVISPLLC